MGRVKTYIGTLVKDLNSLGGSKLKKGDKVKCKRYKDYNKGGWDYHYTGISRKGFVRSSEFLIKEFLKNGN